MPEAYVSDNDLEKIIVDTLREKAESKEFSIENFRIKTFIKEIEKVWHVEESRIKKTLDKLERKGELEIKPRVTDVIIPRGYENRFYPLISRIEPTFILLTVLLIGYLVIGVALSSFDMRIVISTKNPMFLLLVIYAGLVAPLLVGTIIFTVAKIVWNALYKNIKFFKEMIDFFGGTKVWVYALTFTSFVLLLYITLSVFLDFKIEPFYVVSIIITVFAGTLFYGSKQKNVDSLVRID
ncbi:MAG: hypothetical protein HYS80_01545 [Candidatus Aenigmarchaeota archaeon]|nr:hypothetical protein [Candidatus Aenigmarchaeota archaeon]